MACFRGRHPRAALLTSCAVLLASSSISPLFFSQPPTTALAFSNQIINAHYHSSSSSTSAGAVGGIGGIYHVKHGQNRNALPSVLVTGLRKSSILRSKPRKYDIDLTALPADAADEGVPTETESSSPPSPKSSSIKNDLRSIITLVGAQALLLPISAFLAKMLNIPNGGLGAGFAWTADAALSGIQWTAPLFIVAGIMRFIEPYSPALQGVTQATQRSVLAVMGKERRPAFALLVSVLLGAVAGWGEELLFRGVFQTFLAEKFSNGIALAISGIVFGSLHAVTPVYALLAGAASVFFGYLYNVSGNLAVPIICHAVYDVGALMWAHWSVTALSSREQDEILQSGPGAPIMDADP